MPSCACRGTNPKTFSSICSMRSQRQTWTREIGSQQVPRSRTQRPPSRWRFHLSPQSPAFLTAGRCSLPSRCCMRMRTTRAPSSPKPTLEELADGHPPARHPAADRRASRRCSEGRHHIHFGAKRLRAAMRAGLDEVPVVVRDLPADPYAQVAENQKRHGLTPLELARFIRAQVDAGDSNATDRQAARHEPDRRWRITCRCWTCRRCSTRR